MRHGLVATLLLVGGCATFEEGRPGDPGYLAGNPPAELLTVRWRRLLGEPPLIEYKPQEFAQAAGDGNRVFVGCRAGWLYALSPSDGRLLWRKTIPAGISSRPLYLPEAQRLYVGTDDGALMSLDPRTGAVRWLYQAKGPLASPPVEADGVLYFTSGENRLYAVDAQSGVWRWQYEREAPETFAIRGYGAPLVFGGRVYAGFADGYLATLNARTGDVIWARALGGDSGRFLDVDSTPVIDQGTLYVASRSAGLYALDPADGATRWRFEVEGGGTVRLDGDRLFFTATPGGLYCLDRKGRLQWRQSLAGQGELSEPVLLGARHLLVSASDGGAYVVERERGRLLQLFAPGHGITAAPSVDGRRVFVLTNAGFLYAFSFAG